VPDQWYEWNSILRKSSSNSDIGILLSEMPPLTKKLQSGSSDQVNESTTSVIKENSILRLPGTIMLPHNRIFYARPAMKGKGQVRFGLKHARK